MADGIPFSLFTTICLIPSTHLPDPQYKRYDRWKDGQRQVETEAQDGFPYRTPIMTRQGRWGAEVTLVSLRGLFFLCDVVVDTLLTV